MSDKEFPSTGSLPKTPAAAQDGPSQNTGGRDPLPEPEPAASPVAYEQEARIMRMTQTEAH